jgi:hypothetical protein
MASAMAALGESPMCKVISYVVPEGPPYYANGPFKTISKCETHIWLADPVAFIDGLCPLGRIEKATEEALAKINRSHSETSI